MNNKMQEEWKMVVHNGEEYPEYEVSNLGHVRSLDRVVTFKVGESDRTRRIRSKLLRPSDNGCGYSIVTISKNGRSSSVTVHRLVAEAWIPNPDALPCLNHIDEDKSNNCVENLEWCTAQYNSAYSIQRKAKTYRSRQVYCITDDKLFRSSAEAARYYQVSDVAIGKACQGVYHVQGKDFVYMEDTTDAELQ